MKFKKQTETLNISRLEAEELISQKRIGEIKCTYYEVWDRDIHLGNLCGGTRIPKRQWEFVPICGDTGGVDQGGLNIKQLFDIVAKLYELNEKIV